VETSASFEARYAPLSYPTASACPIVPTERNELCCGVFFLSGIRRSLAFPSEVGT
jgi:hypothetical protein